VTGQILDIVLRNAFWLGALAFIALSGATLWAGEALHRRLEDDVVPLWVLEHVAMPLGHVLAVAAFLLLGYPVVYGTAVPLPDLQTVLTAHAGWASILVNVVFVATLLLSLLPVIGEMTAFVLPAQGIAGAALLFSWACDARPGASCADVHYWPDLKTMTLIVLGVVLAHYFGGLLHRWLDHGAAHRAVAIHLVIHALLLIPVLVYAVFLGAQPG
jgi:hypothetical protein